MASENSKIDSNRRHTLMGITDDVAAELRRLLVDPTTGALKCTATISDLTVANGGTGLTSLTAYAVLCGGTTTTGDMQQVSGVGTAGQVLTSNGAGALPTWEAAGATGANTALSNLASVAINAALVPGTAGALDFGSTAKPWGALWLAGTSGTPGTNQFKITGASTSGLRTITLPDASITVNAAGDISGTTLAANVVTSSITTVGTLVGGATGVGFTVALGTSTISGILTSANGGTGNGFTKFSGATTAEKTYTLPDASCNILTSNAAVTVPQGGTGAATFTAYAVLCGGTTATGAFQSIASVGTAGQLLTSNGAGALPTFQGLFDENGTIAILDDALSATGKFSGITENGTAGAALSFGQLCYLNDNDSRWELVDANLSDGYDKKLGICVLAAAGDGSATRMLLWGKVRADAQFPTLTIGAPVYMGETAGEVVVTQPTTADVAIRIVGFGNTADELFFCPSNDYIVHT